MKHDLYNRALACVLKHTEIDLVVLMKSNREDVVDARCLLVCAMSRYGLTDIEVAELMGVTRQCVSKLRSSLDIRRRKWSVRTNWQHICNELAME